MKRFPWEKFGPAYPLAIFLGFVLFIAGMLWVIYRLVEISWIWTAVLLGALTTISFVRARHVWPSVWSLAVNIAASLAYIWVYFVLDTRWWWKALLLIAFTPLFVLGNKSVQADIARGMRFRREQANRTLQKVLSKHRYAPERFGLYLRPFDTTARLPVQAVPAEFEINEIRPHLDFETMLMRTLDKEMELLALGRPEDISEGIARVTIQDKDWQEVVLQLADQASLIIAVPLARAGTIWEMRELKARRLLGKTVFLMPEAYRQQPNGVVVSTENSQIWDVGIRRYDSAKHYINTYAEWRQARANLREEGYDLPMYSGSGALFTMDPATYQVKQIAPLPLSVLIRKEAYIRTVLAGFGLLPQRKNFNPDLLAALEGATFPNIRSREFALYLAFDLYATNGDVKTAARVLQCMHRYTRGRPVLLNGVLDSFTVLFDDPAKKGISLDDLELMERWVDVTRSLPGIDPDCLDQAYLALDMARLQLGHHPAN